MPVPSSLEMLDPAYAKTIRIIVSIRVSLLIGHVTTPPYWNYHYDWIGRIILFIFECTILLNCDCEQLWQYFSKIERIIGIIASLFNVEEVMEIVQSWRIVWQKGTRYIYKRLASIMHAASFSYLGLYLCEFFFFFFFSPLSWCLSNYFCAIVMKWLYNEFFFYVEIVVLYNDLIKLWYIEESLLCHELKFKEIFEEPFMWFF